MFGQVILRAATEVDAPAIAELCGGLGYSAEADAIRERLHRLSKSNVDMVVVAETHAGNVVGWLQAHASTTVESGSRVEIVGMIVSPSARRHGIGRMLVECAELWAQSLSAGTIVVRSNVKRVESHPFYSALGFSETKRQAVYRKALP